jgi:hypothetical protein
MTLLDAGLPAAGDDLPKLGEESRLEVVQRWLVVVIGKPPKRWDGLRR